MRHSDPKLTIGVYAKASIHDLAGAVESLPDLTNPAPESEPLRATGTDSLTSHCLEVAAQGQARGQFMSPGVASWRNSRPLVGSNGSAQPPGNVGS